MSGRGGHSSLFLGLRFNIGLRVFLQAFGHLADVVYAPD